MGAHALLSASSAHRWMACTPSVRLTEHYPDTTSDYAAEGTLAHELCELNLTKYFVKGVGPKTYAKKLDVFKANALWHDEMLGHAEAYFDYVKEIYLKYKGTPFIAVEKRVDYSAYAEKGFGTADCIIISGNDLHVIDFKYGKGVPVAAESNPQLMLYALGAVSMYRMLYAIKTIHLHVFQPRINNTSEWTLDIDALDAFAEEVKVKAQEALRGDGAFVAGEHCRFCPARSNCRTRADENIKLAGFVKQKPPLLSNDEIGEYLKIGADVKKWLEEIKAFALSECLAGRDVKGWKAVEGRGSSDWTDGDKAFETLMANGVDESILYERVPLSLAKTEKVIGKKQFNALVGDFVVKNPGKPALVLETDKRKAITNQITAEAAFREE